MANFNQSCPTLDNVSFTDNGAGFHTSGGGMRNSNGSSPTLTNVTFSRNRTFTYGAGMYNSTNSSPTLIGCNFSSNSGEAVSNADYSSPTLTNVAFNDNNGSGMTNSWYCSPLLTDVIFTGNRGGGMINEGNSSPSLTNVTFSYNQGNAGLPAMFNNGGSPTLTNVIFANNSGMRGGGMYNQDSSPTLTNVTFRDNSAFYGGGGMYNIRSSPILTNVIFDRNSSTNHGGAMYNMWYSAPTMNNVTLSGNTAGGYGGGMFIGGYSSPTLTNCILWGNVAPVGHEICFEFGSSATLNYCDVQGTGWTGVDGCIDADPLFVDAANGDLRLLPNSPCIDSGTNASAPLFDRDGNVRPQDGNGDENARTDMGAYESPAFVNHAPSFLRGADVTVQEDAGLQDVTRWATAISAGPADESGQALDFIVTNDNTALFAAQPAISANGTLTFAPAYNASGTATVTVRLHDNGGTTNGGADTSPAQIFTITISPVNDTPVAQTTALTTLEDNAIEIDLRSLVSDVETAAGDLLFRVSDAANGSVELLSDGHTARFTPAANYNGSASFSYSVTDTGDGASPAITVGPVAISVSVTPVNDAPSFTRGADQTVWEDAWWQEIPGWATAVSAGPADESAQAVNFIVTNDNPALFAVQPAISANGTLTYMSRRDASGTATVTVRLHDNGGTANGGTDTSLAQTFTIQVLRRPSISGVVFVDVNSNGLFDANEPGIDWARIELQDVHGNVLATTLTYGGVYLFDDVAPNTTYRIHEVQPTGVNDGIEILGNLGGLIVADDTMQLTVGEDDAIDYVFAELGQRISSGDTASIGFWQNKRGQELITRGGERLAEWLTRQFYNVFGHQFYDEEWEYRDGAYIAAFYRDQLFRQISGGVAGPAKVDAQFMAVALATFFTSRDLAGDVASGYGFHVTDTGIGTKVVNVGTCGAAFGVANYTDRTVLQLLQATNARTDQPNNIYGAAWIYDLNGDGQISSGEELLLRTLANTLYTQINESGGI